jgi:hypothetical protein
MTDAIPALYDALESKDERLQKAARRTMDKIQKA